MVGIYCADPALQTAVHTALELYGLQPDPAAVSRRPRPAATLERQLERVRAGRNVIALVERTVPVGADGRRLIERLVDSAFQRIEEAEDPVEASRCSTATEAAVIAYAAAGGGAIGSFESFRLTFTSTADLLEPAVDRQEVKPPPLTTNPTRRPTGPRIPGPSSPTKTNPTRTIRSSRWTRKGVGS
jgi:hypothetical protein